MEDSLKAGYIIGDVIAVAADWEHPRDWQTKKMLPLCRQRLTPEVRKEIEEEQKQWDAGLELWLAGRHPDQLSGEYGHTRHILYEHIHDTRPTFSDYLPDWGEHELTHIVFFCRGTDVTASPLFSSVEKAAQWAVRYWQAQRRTEVRYADEKEVSYADALAFVVRCVLRHEGARFLEKISENINAWPEFDCREGEVWSASEMNRRIILPYLESRRK
jgi:hypothetical protein